MFGTSIFSRHRALGATFAASLALASANAWALGSTPVTVTNTDSNPAVTRTIDEPGRIPYQTRGEPTGCAKQQFNSDFDCFVNIPLALAPGQRLVIERISGLALFSGAPPPPSAFVVILSNESRAAQQSFTVLAPLGTVAAFDQPVSLYFDPGDQSPQVTVDFGPTISDPNDVPAVTVTGYILDCNAGPCAPIRAN